MTTQKTQTDQPRK